MNKNCNNSFKELIAHKRTISKTITWRVIATVTTVLTVYLWSGDLSFSLASGLVANAMKTIFYYIHERVWNLMDFGRLIGPAENRKK